MELFSDWLPTDFFFVSVVHTGHGLQLEALALPILSLSSEQHPPSSLWRPSDEFLLLSCDSASQDHGRLTSLCSPCKIFQAFLSASSPIFQSHALCVSCDRSCRNFPHPLARLGARRWKCWPKNSSLHHRPLSHPFALKPPIQNSPLLQMPSGYRRPL